MQGPRLTLIALPTLTLGLAVGLALTTGYHPTEWLAWPLVIVGLVALLRSRRASRASELTHGLWDLGVVAWCLGGCFATTSSWPVDDEDRGAWCGTWSSGLEVIEVRHRCAWGPECCGYDIRRVWGGVFERHRHVDKLWPPRFEEAGALRWCRGNHAALFTRPAIRQRPPSSDHVSSCGASPATRSVPP